MRKISLPTMTEPRHWLLFLSTLTVCFVGAAISFVYAPLFGVVFVVAANVMSVGCVVLYFKNAK
jgi:hypothetical protein